MSDTVASLHRLEEKHGAPYYQHGVVDDTADVQLAKQPVAQGRSREDDRILVKKTLAQGSPLGDVTVTDKDYDWIASKQDEYEKARFEAWIVKNLDKKDKPYLYNSLKKNFAEIIHRREQTIDEQAEIQKRLAKMRFKAVEEWTKEDFMLVYLIAQGKIFISDRPLYELDQTNNLGANAWGWFNPLRYRTIVKPESMRQVLGWVKDRLGNPRIDFPVVSDNNRDIQKFLQGVIRNDTANDVV